MTLAEQFRQEGRQEGRLQGLQDAILTTLKVRLGSVPEGLAEAVRAVRDNTRLENLQWASVTCATLEEFAATL